MTVSLDSEGSLRRNVRRRSVRRELVVACILAVILSCIAALSWWRVQDDLQSDRIVVALNTLWMVVLPMGLSAFLLPDTPGITLLRMLIGLEEQEPAELPKEPQEKAGSDLVMVKIIAGIVAGMILAGIAGYAFDNLYRWHLARPGGVSVEAATVQALAGVIQFILLPDFTWTIVMMRWNELRQERLRLPTHKRHT